MHLSLTTTADLDVLADTLRARGHEDAHIVEGHRMEVTDPDGQPIQVHRA